MNGYESPTAQISSSSSWVLIKKINGTWQFAVNLKSHKTTKLLVYMVGGGSKDGGTRSSGNYFNSL